MTCRQLNQAHTSWNNPSSACSNPCQLDDTTPNNPSPADQFDQAHAGRQHREQPIASDRIHVSSVKLTRVGTAYRRQLEDLIPSQLEQPAPLEDPTPARKHHTSSKDATPVYAGLNDATCSALCSLATNKMPRRCFTHTPPRPFPLVDVCKPN
jgi:hypothetical protein